MSDFMDRLNTPYAYEGDSHFIGVNSRLDPQQVPPGYLSASVNARMNDGRINLRKGADFLAGLTGVSPSYTYDADNEEVFASGLYSEPDDDKKDWLVSVTKKKAIIWDGTTPYYVNYYSAVVSHPNVDAGADTFTSTAHKFQVGDAVQLTTDGTLPTPLAINTTYYVIDASANTFKLATSYTNALAGTAINLTDQGNGDHTIQSIVDTSHDPEVRQVFNEVYIMRYKGRPLVWDGATAATGSVVNTEFESLDSAATLRGGGGPTGDPFPSTNITAYIANRLVGVQPRSIATPTQGVTDSSTVILTDLLESNHVTPTNSEWYINEGSADYVVGFAPYQENNMLIFNRRSVVMASNAHDTENSVRYPVTTRYGCVAKKTIVNAGNFIFFLSDDGVMQLNPALDVVTQAGAAVSKMQGAVMPISRDIQDQIDALLSSATYDERYTCGVVYKNRYYLSLRGAASRVFVYDMINGAWVGVDQYNGITFSDFVTMPYDGELRLFGCTDKGWYLLEENDGLDDSSRTIGDDAATDTTAIVGGFQTRDYTFKTPHIKRFHKVEVAASVANGDSFTVSVGSRDPDSSKTFSAYTHSSSSEELIRKNRTRQRGHAAYINILTTAGNPVFRFMNLSATVAQNNMRNVE